MTERKQVKVYFISDMAGPPVDVSKLPGPNFGENVSSLHDAIFELFPRLSGAMKEKIARKLAIEEYHLTPRKICDKLRSHWGRGYPPAVGYIRTYAADGWTGLHEWLAELLAENLPGEEVVNELVFVAIRVLTDAGYAAEAILECLGENAERSNTIRSYCMAPEPMTEDDRRLFHDHFGAPQIDDSAVDWLWINDPLDNGASHLVAIWLRRRRAWLQPDGHTINPDHKVPGQYILHPGRPQTATKQQSAAAAAAAVFGAIGKP